ncbi:MAG: TolC family protein [Bacteroidales bacterium]|nr:TolC family protein [Bacteroidales bacterium]
MKTQLFKTWLLLGLCFTVTVFSSSAQEAIPLSLEDARSYALEHNRNLKNAGLAIDEAGAMLKETIAQGLPQISATVDYSNFFGSTATLGAMPGMEIEFNPTSNVNVSVGQLIFSGSYIVGIQSARLFKELSETSLEKTEQDIRALVTQAYYLALIARESQNIVAANLENMSELLEKTRAMVDVGVAEELDYDQLTVQASMLADAHRAAGRQLELSKNMLRLQMGMPAGQPIVLINSIEDIMSLSDVSTSLTKTFRIAEHPDYRLVSLQTNLAEKQVKMEQSAYLPSLSGFYNYTEKLLKPEFDITPNHVIGLNLNIPLFSSGVRKARVDQARIRLEIAGNQQELLSQQLLIQEQQLRYNLNNALEQFESQQANLTVARRVFNSFNNKYEQGMVSSLDLITANNNYLQAENSYISAMLQLMEAQLAMEKLLNIL